MKFICLGNYRQSEQNKKFSFFLCFATETIRQDVRRRRERGGDQKNQNINKLNAVGNEKNF